MFALVLELWTFTVALKEIGGWRARENRTNTTVLAVLLEDAVALLGIVLTLLVAGISMVWGPHPEFDAAVAIAVGVLLGVMAMFLGDAEPPAADRRVGSLPSIGRRRTGSPRARPRLPSGRSCSMTIVPSCSSGQDTKYANRSPSVKR